MRTTPAYTYSAGCFGCFTSVLGAILLVWLVTHVAEVNAALDRIIR